MDANHDFANLRPERHEEGAFLGLNIQLLVTIHGLVLVLVNLLSIQYQNSNSSPFNTHYTMTRLLIGAVCVYFLALMELILPIPKAGYHHFIRLICYISGVVACTCLVFIIFPIFGWVILSLFIIRILANTYPQLIKLLESIVIKLFDKYIQLYFNSNNLQVESCPQALEGNSMEQEDEGGMPMEQEDDDGSMPMEQEDGGGSYPMEV